MATLIGDVSAETLTEDEALALGISTIVHAGEIDPDNYAVSAALQTAGIPQMDKEGRPIISYRQYTEIGKAGGRVDGYALRVLRPGTRGTWIVQASKYLKWFGLGYEALGCPPEHTHLAAEIRRSIEAEMASALDLEGLDERQSAKKIEQFINKNAKAVAQEISDRMQPRGSKRPVRTVQPVEAAVDTDGITLYYCRDKYPDCKRVFDNDKGLKFHWRKEHEGVLNKKPGKVPAEE